MHTSIFLPSTTVPCSLSRARSASALFANVTKPNPCMQGQTKQHALNSTYRLPRSTCTPICRHFDTSHISKTYRVSNSKRRLCCLGMRILKITLRLKLRLIFVPLTKSKGSSGSLLIIIFQIQKLIGQYSRSLIGVEIVSCFVFALLFYCLFSFRVYRVLINSRLWVGDERISAFLSFCAFNCTRPSFFCWKVDNWNQILTLQE